MIRIDVFGEHPGWGAAVLTPDEAMALSRELSNAALGAGYKVAK